jgi:GntR family transcriptional regulator
MYVHYDTRRAPRQREVSAAGRLFPLEAAHTGGVIVDRDSALPLWAQVLADLRRRLARGEFGSRFPGDEELRAAYGVSRHTVREAVRRLQAEGVVERGRGRGTFVREPMIEQPLGAFYSLFRSVEAQGFVQRSVVRHLEERRDGQAAKVLGCAPGEPLVYLERLRLADGEPIVLDCSWLPAALARPLLQVDFTRTALYRELHVRCGVRANAGWERLRPVLPTREQRDLLGLTARTPALAIERLTLRDTTPVEWRHGVVRADRFSYVARWTARNLGAGFELAAGGAGGEPVDARLARRDERLGR